MAAGAGSRRRGHENTCGIDQRLQPNTTQWGGRGEKLCVNHLRQMSKSARGVSHFYPPERQFNLTRRVYGEGRDVFFRSAAWSRNPDLAFVTLSRCNFKDGLTTAQSQSCLLILIARFEKGKSRMNHMFCLCGFYSAKLLDSSLNYVLCIIVVWQGDLRCCQMRHRSVTNYTKNLRG